MHEMKKKIQTYASPEEALLKTKRIWEVLADQPSLHKYEVYHLLGLQPDSFHCPCCQYSKQEIEKLLQETGTERDYCHFCPLYPESEGGCEQEGEPYRIWVDAIAEKVIKEAATAFISLVNSTLQRIKEDQALDGES